MTSQVTSKSAARTEMEALVEAVVSEHESALLRYAAGILGDFQAAQDAVQAAFIKLFQFWKPGLKPTRSVRAWLMRVTHNEAVDYMRRESRLRRLHERHAQQSPSQADPAQDCAMNEEERRRLVLRHLRRLDSAEQQVILLRLQEGLSYAEIGEITGRTEGNVGCLLHHAVRKLAERVRPEAAGR